MTDARQTFLQKAAIQTDACRRITALASTRCGEDMFFGSSTSQLSEKYIKERFREIVIDKGKSGNEMVELNPHQVFILEIE